MQVTFPENCTTEASRLSWSYKAQEKLRTLHNWVGKWYREGITENVYNQFPDKVKSRYSYVAKLSQTDWNDFQNNVFEPISVAIINALGSARDDARNGSFWNPDLDGDIK